MQLKFNQQKSIGQSIASRLIKTLIFILIFMIAIFLLDKINFPSPVSDIKKNITNDIKKLK